MRRIWRGRAVLACSSRASYEIADTPDAVAIVAVDAEERVVLVRQRREAAGGDAARAAGGARSTTARSRWRRRSASFARRQGCAAGAGASSTSFWTLARLRQRAHAPCSSPTGSRRASPNRTSGEELEVVRWTLPEVEARLPELEDATTLVGLLLYLRERR